jgi:hypothetical protein
MREHHEDSEEEKMGAGVVARRAKKAISSLSLPQKVSDISGRLVDSLKRSGLAGGGQAMDTAKKVYSWMKENKELVHAILGSSYLNPANGGDYGKKAVMGLKAVGLGHMKDGEEYSSESDEEKEGMGFAEITGGRKVGGKYAAELVKGSGKKRAPKSKMPLPMLLAPKIEKDATHGYKHYYADAEDKSGIDILTKMMKKARKGKGKAYMEGGAVYSARASHQDSTQHDASEYSSQGEKMGSGKRKKAPSARNLVVKKIMKEKGLSLPQASKYVKEHGLY